MKPLNLKKKLKVIIVVIFYLTYSKLENKHWLSKVTNIQWLKY
jgi:hypothetical protein